MLLLLLLTSAFLLVPWAGAGRIIGGWEAKPHSRPYMAYLSIGSESGRSHCGGFLVRPDAVLSAAHCVAGKTKVNITVTLGAHNITNKKERSRKEFPVHHWVIHPNYSRHPIENDIMLLKLKPKAKLTKEVSYIRLPSHNERVEPGTLCEVAGWGRTSMTGEKTSVLMEVDLKVQSEKVCEKSFKRNYRQPSVICVGDKDGKKSTFRGDSGGPLVCNGKAHGIVSYGRRYCIFPKVFTRVSYFEPWIQKELRKFALQDLPDSSSSD
ncbi:duodenase-1-like [Theristicus caerulescens]